MARADYDYVEMFIERLHLSAEKNTCRDGACPVSSADGDADAIGDAARTPRLYESVCRGQTASS